MSDNCWAQNPLTPIELKESDASFCTVTDLLAAIKEDDILNIAVTGPYGSGKSSVLRTFQKKVDKDIKILDISLATLDVDESLLKGEKTEVEIKQQKLLNRKIEYSILQQIVYRKKLEDLPYSRMKKIRDFSNHTIRCIAAYVVGFVVCMAFALKMSLLQIPLLYEIFNVPNCIQDVISIISVIFCLVIIYEILKYFIKNFGGLRIQKVSLKGSEINVHDDSSIFNRYLEEILYFFQCTDYNVVIIEDLDRFNTSDIFLKLRELNHLINKSEMINRKVKFIYAVKDDMFRDSSRTKFFDYITTVIPVITTTNSKVKLKQALNDLGHAGEVPDDDIRDIAFHINDMRLLYNIANEYHQYIVRLSNKKHSLDASKMLAMMTIKNYHPDDFSELHIRKGRLFEALSQETKRKYVDFALSTYLTKKEEIARKIEAYDVTQHLSVYELRLVYLVAIVKKLPVGYLDIVIDNQGYQITDVANNDHLFNEIMSNDWLKYHYIGYHGRAETGKIEVVFSDIENEVNPNFTYQQRVAQLGADRVNLEAEIKNVEFEKTRVRAYSISELIEKFDIYREGFFKKIGLSELEEDFIRRGFITEDYNDYISYFYSGILSMADRQLSLDIKLNRKTEYDSAIDNVELLLQELPISAFRYESMWNYQIMDYLVDHKEASKDVYNIVLSSLLDNDSAHFLYLYSDNSNFAKNIFADCMLHDSNKMWKKIANAEIKERQSLYQLWFSTCQLQDIQDSQSEWITKNYDFIALNYSAFAEEKQSLFSKSFRYERLTLSNTEMLNEVVENGCYILNDHNAPIIVDVKNAKEDISKLDGIEEMQYALEKDLLVESWYNIKEYYKESEKKVDETLVQYIEKHIDKISIDKKNQGEEYKALFQTLLEYASFGDSVYKKICDANTFKLEFSSAILSLSQTKLIMLVETGTFKYDISILTSLNKISPKVTCAYMLLYREKLSNMLKVGKMNTQLAEELLYNGNFNLIEYHKIIDSLNPSNIVMNQSLANRICEILSIRYSVCDDKILYDAIKLCSNKSHSVRTVVNKILQSQLSHSLISDLVTNLPNEYHDLIRLHKQPRFEDNSYNKLLIDTLKNAGYISSYTIGDGTIKVNTKRK